MSSSGTVSKNSHTFSWPRFSGERKKTESSWCICDDNLICTCLDHTPGTQSTILLFVKNFRTVTNYRTLCWQSLYVMFQVLLEWCMKGGFQSAEKCEFFKTFLRGGEGWMLDAGSISRLLQCVNSYKRNVKNEWMNECSFNLWYKKQTRYYLRYHHF